MDKEYTVLRFCTRRENMITDEVDTNLRQKEEIFSSFDFWILRMNLVRQIFYVISGKASRVPVFSSHKWNISLILTCCKPHHALRYHYLVSYTVF